MSNTAYVQTSISIANTRRSSVAHGRRLGPRGSSGPPVRVSSRGAGTIAARQRAREANTPW